MSSTIPHERTLRKITIATLIPAFTLIVASGAMSSRGGCGYRYCYRYSGGPTIIFFGLIPTFFSAITSALFLRTAEDPLAKRPHWRTGLWFLIDFFLGASNFAVLLPVWIFDPMRMDGHANWMMLETYATVFMLANMFIHAYLALYHPFKALSRAGSFRSCFFPTECPHCHGNLRAAQSVGDKRAGYSLLRAEEYLDEQEPEASTGINRQSTDSEVATV